MAYLSRILGTAAALLLTASAASAQDRAPQNPACLDLTIVLPQQVVGIHPLPDGRCTMKMTGQNFCKIVILNALGNEVLYSKDSGYFIMIDPFSTDQAYPCELLTVPK